MGNLNSLIENFKTVKAVWEQQKHDAESKNIAGFEMGYIDGNIAGLDFVIEYLKGEMEAQK